MAEKTNHIIEVPYSEGGKTVTRSAYQYDYGQALKLTGFPEGTLPDVFEVHFAGVLQSKEAVTRIGGGGIVQIPDICLRSSARILAWLYLHDTETDGETIYEIQVPVVARPAVFNQRPTPQQQDVITETIAALTGLARRRIHSLTDVPLSFGNVIEAEGIPVYVEHPEEYAEYGITDTGWYIFARIEAKSGVYVTAATSVSGADGYIATIGNNYVDVAVRFEVAAVSRTVTIEWGMDSEVFSFRATDLAIRNLDYRVTFYVYDAAKYVTWEYAPTADATFAADKKYYVRDGDGYALAEVTSGEAVPAIYYEAIYTLTADETFQAGKTYYIRNGDAWEAATVTEGEAVAADTYYEVSYQLTADMAFLEGKTYYTKDGTTYTAATVTAGDAMPTVYYNHSKCIISGLIRNITYKLDTIIDCPMEFILPEIEDESHGCWFEIRCRHAGEYSMTLTPPSADVKIATEHTQRETAGINMINLHYTVIDGLKIWRFMNTHSSIPST